MIKSISEAHPAHFQKLAHGPFPEFCDDWRRFSMTPIRLGDGYTCVDEQTPFTVDCAVFRVATNQRITCDFHCLFSKHSKTASKQNITVWRSRLKIDKA